MPDLPWMSSLSSPTDFAQRGAILDDRFRLDSYLGSGTLHRVFAAWDILENKAVCVKIPYALLLNSTGFKQRYREGVLSLMMHPGQGWLTPSMLGEHAGDPFQVFPLTPGQAIAPWFLDRGRSMESLLKTIGTCLQILDRLHHTLGRIHGGISPETLLIADDHQPFFSGLAITGRLEDHLMDKAQSDKPVYFAPEQLVGQRSQPAADLFSLALVLYQTLTGCHPFKDLNPIPHNLTNSERLLASLLAQLKGHPPLPSSLMNDIPRWADRFLTRCLLPRPEDRFQTAAEALAWLHRHTRGIGRNLINHDPLPPIGREQEMEFLLECLDALKATPAVGHVIRLHGPPGIGKSRCTSYLKKQAQLRGIKAVEGQREPESPLHLQGVLASLHEAFDHPIPEPLFKDARPAIESFIEAAFEEPLLLLLDDMAQADDTLIHFLKELKQALPDVALLVILSEDGTPFRTPTANEFMETLDHVLILPPLDSRGIANLIEERAWITPSPSLVTWIHKVSAGHPLAAQLLLDFLQAEGLIREELTLDWVSSPSIVRPNLQELLTKKIERLTPITRSLLETASVLGDSFRLATLQAITYRSPDEVDEAIAEAIRSELLLATGPERLEAFSWRHHLFRQALWNGLPLRQHQRIHRLAAALYSRGQPNPAKLAYHFLGAGDAGEFCAWGLKAAANARELGRRSESAYWLHLLIEGLDDSRWLGPNLTKARNETASDQSEFLNIEEWSQWLHAYYGKAPWGDVDLETLDPLYATQLLIGYPLPWPEWKQAAIELIEILQDSVEINPLRSKALELLGAQWASLCQGREPCPIACH